MVARQDGAIYDAEYEEARAQLRLAKRDEDKARDDLTEAKLLQERSERFKMRADQQATEARTRESGANRKAQETRRKIENARRQGLPKFRLDAETQRWQAEEQRAGQDVRRHEDESRRKEREGKEVAKTIAAKNEVMLEKIRTSHSWSQRITYLASTTRRETRSPGERRAKTTGSRPGVGGHPRGHGRAQEHAGQPRA